MKKLLFILGFFGVFFLVSKSSIEDLNRKTLSIFPMARTYLPGYNAHFTPSTHRIFPNFRLIVNRKGRKGRIIERLFDGDTLTTANSSGVSETAFGLPGEAFLILDSFYNNIKIESFHRSGSQPGYRVTTIGDNNDGTLLADNYSKISTLDSLGTDTLSSNLFNTWSTNTNLANGVNVRFIRIKATNAATWDGISEIRLYGDPVAAAPSPFRSETVAPLIDPGKHFYGANMIDDKNKDTAFAEANTFRIGYPGWWLDKESDYPIDINDLAYVFKFDRFGGTNAAETRVFSFARANDVLIQNYFTGGTNKWLTAAQAASFSFNGYSQTNMFKYLMPGADSLVKANWAGKARRDALWVTAYGSNTSASFSGYVTEGLGAALPGAGGLSILELDNEWTRDWQGQTAHFSPDVEYTMIDTSYAKAKLVDSNVKIYVGAITFMDTQALKALWFEHYLRHQTTKPVPWNGWNFNCYLNNEYDGQNTIPQLFAVTPEQWQVRKRLLQLKSISEQMFPNRSGMRWTEYGFSVDAGSSFEVKAIAGKTLEETKADLNLRLIAIASTVPGLEAVYGYFFDGDGTGTFNGMAWNDNQFNGGGAYIGTVRRPVGNVMAGQLSILKNYNAWSTILTNGDSTNVWVIKNTKPNSTDEVLRVWNGTYNGSTHANYVINGITATSATLITLSYNNKFYTSTPLTITGGSITIPTVSEKIQLVVLNGTTIQNPGKKIYRARKA